MSDRTRRFSPSLPELLEESLWCSARLLYLSASSASSSSLLQHGSKTCSGIFFFYFAGVLRLQHCLFIYLCSMSGKCAPTHLKETQCSKICVLCVSFDAPAGQLCQLTPVAGIHNFRQGFKKLLHGWNSLNCLSPNRNKLNVLIGLASLNWTDFDTKINPIQDGLLF